MGLTIILTIAISVIVGHNYKKETGNKFDFFSVLATIIIGGIAGAVITFIVSSAAFDHGVTYNSIIKLDCVSQQTEQLEEFQSGVYVIPVNEKNMYGAPDTRKLSIRINGQTKRVHIEDTILYLNSPEHKIVTNEYKFSSILLRILLFNTGRKIYDIHTPEKHLYGEYSI